MLKRPELIEGHYECRSLRKSSFFLSDPAKNWWEATAPKRVASRP
jgi:hypothetical protein